MEKSFRLFALRGNPPPPSRPSANPSGSPSNPLVALRRSSYPFVEIFLPFRPSWTSSPPFPTFGKPLSTSRRTPLRDPPPFQPLRTPSPFFVPLRGKVFSPFRPSWTSSPPYPTLGEPLSTPRQPLRGPSPFFVPLRGKVFSPFRPSWESSPPTPSRPLANPSRPPRPTPSCPFAVLRAPSWKSFCLFAPRGHLLPPTRPSANPSRPPANPFAPLRRSSCPFVEKSFCLFALRGNPSPPFPTFGKPLSCPPPTPSWPFAVLRAPSWKSFCLFALRGNPSSPFPTFGKPLPTPANPLVALRRSSCPFVDNLFAFFLPAFDGPLPDLRQTPPVPPPTPSRPFAVLRAPSWKSLFAFSPFVGILPPPSRPSANPSRAPANPFVPLRRSSCPFVEKSFRLFALRGNPPPPPTPSRPSANPSRAPANPFVPLRRSSCPFVEIFLPFSVLRAP